MNTLYQRFFFIDLASGITRLNAWTLLFASFVTIGFLTFVNVGQVYILNEILLIPRAEQGTLTGDLAFLTEIVAIALVGTCGVLSDRIGRRPIIIAGLLFMALAYVLYPLATSIPELAVYRAIYAVGIAAGTGMMVTLANDYPQELSRGKLIALGGFFNGLGVITVTGVFGQIPHWLVSIGVDAVSAGRYMHWLAAGFLIPAAVLYRLGLKGGTPVRKEERPPVRALIRSGFEAARNPRIALAYLAAFVARSDMVVVGTFTVLWGTIAGIEQGMTTASAAGRGTLLFVISQSAALVWMAVMGPLLDRINRVTGMLVGTGIAAASFLAMGFVNNPLNPGEYYHFALIGIGQISCFFASQALIGQEAPIATRGSIMGMAGVSGAVGILIATGIGGRLFDGWMPAGPFIIVGAANALIMLFAIGVRIMAPGPGPKELRASRAA